MCPNADVADKQGRTTPMDCLTTARRRRVVRILSERASSMTERQLAAQLVARKRETSIVAVPDEAVETVWLGLRHVDLPKLNEAGLATWDESDAIVTPASHPILDDDQFQALLASDDDTVVAALTSDRCRHVLAEVAGSTDGLSRAELAESLAARRTDGEPSSAAIERAGIQLYHIFLPQLEAAGLVERDADGGEVTYCGPPDLPGMAPVGEGSTLPTDADSEVEIQIP